MGVKVEPRSLYTYIQRSGALLMLMRIRSEITWKWSLGELWYEGV